MTFLAWDPDRAWFLERVLEATSVTDLAARCGVSRDTVRRYARTHNIDLTQVRSYGCVPRNNFSGAVPAKEPEPQREMTDKELIALCEARGIPIMRDPVIENRVVDVDIPVESDKSFTFGVVSDTHFGSKWQQPTLLERAYDYFEKHEIPLVLMPGDLCSGTPTMHPGMVHQIFLPSATDQTEYIQEVYPQRPGIRTLMISGNHDHAHMRANGYNIVHQVCKERDDLEYLGVSGAYVNLNGISIYLHHPSGGVPYARSYRQQKHIEQFAPEQKPKMLISGHLHVTQVLESYRNVYAFLAGCFEAQTPYMMEKGIFPEIGFSTVKVEYDEDGAVAFTKRWKPFYVPIDQDYPRRLWRG